MNAEQPKVVHRREIHLPSGTLCAARAEGDTTTDEQGQVTCKPCRERWERLMLSCTGGGTLVYDARQFLDRAEHAEADRNALASLAKRIADERDQLKARVEQLQAELAEAQHQRDQALADARGLLAKMKSVERFSSHEFFRGMEREEDLKAQSASLEGQAAGAEAEAGRWKRSAEDLQHRNAELVIGLNRLLAEGCPASEAERQRIRAVLHRQGEPALDDHQPKTEGP